MNSLLASNKLPPNVKFIRDAIICDDIEGAKP